MPRNQQILLDNRPQGEATVSNFKLAAVDTPALQEGQVLVRRELSQRAGCQGVDLAPRHYHALVALDGDCLFFECKAGPFVPLGEGERPAWAPLEGAPDAKRYRSWMRAQFD